MLSVLVAAETSRRFGPPSRRAGDTRASRRAVGYNGEGMSTREYLAAVTKYKDGISELIWQQTRIDDSQETEMAPGP